MFEGYFLDIHSGHIFRDMHQTNVMYIHVWRCFSGDTLRRYFWRYAPDQCDVYPCPEMFSRDNSGDIFGDMLCRYFWRYAPDQCDVYPCLEMIFWRYTLDIFPETCSRPM